jgi:hypothetical protein
MTGLVKDRVPGTVILASRAVAAEDVSRSRSGGVEP